MSFSFGLGPFKGLLSATAGDSPAGYARSLLNVKVGDGRILPRYGYKALSPKPLGIVSVHGFARLDGYGDEKSGYAERLEWVSIETRNGRTCPYSVDPATWTRTEITNKGVPLALGGGDWLAFCFGGTSYWINPGNDPSAYAHEVGDSASWAPLQNAAYEPVVSDPSFAVTVGDPHAYRRPLDPASDTISSSTSGNYLNGISYVASVATDGGLDVRGSIGDASKVASIVLTCLFGSPADMSYDYCAIEAIGGQINKDFVAGSLVEVRIGGAWSAPPQHETLASDRTSVAVTWRMKDVANPSAVEAIRVTLKGDPWANQKNRLGFTLSAIQYGGTYLAAPNSQARPWDKTYAIAETTYGVRFLDSQSATPTGIRSVTYEAFTFGTVSLGPAAHVGDNVLLSAAADLQAPYADDPAGARFTMQFLRLDSTGVWRVLGAAPNTANQSLRDRYEEREVLLLPKAEGAATFVPGTSAPVFSAQGFVGGAPFKGFVAWFRAGGYQNVQLSRVGNALALSSPGDDATTLDGSPEDEARGATFTLADDQADEPLGGVQAGEALLIVGRKGVYGMTGDTPSKMTPPRKAPGSMGCVGRFSFARYRDDQGTPGIAWLDRSGENVWFVGAATFASTEIQGRPQELSHAIRGHLRTFLLDEQLDKYPGLSLTDAQMDVDEATGSLWIVLGSRAAVLRPPSLVDGQRQWEMNDYSLVPVEPSTGGGGSGGGGGAGSGGGGGSGSGGDDPAGDNPIPYSVDDWQIVWATHWEDRNGVKGTNSDGTPGAPALTTYEYSGVTSGSSLPPDSPEISTGSVGLYQPIGAVPGEPNRGAFANLVGKLTASFRWRGKGPRPSSLLVRTVCSVSSEGLFSLVVLADGGTRETRDTPISSRRLGRLTETVVRYRRVGADSAFTMTLSGDSPTNCVSPSVHGGFRLDVVPLGTDGSDATVTINWDPGT